MAARRKINPSIPSHIDQAAIPKGVYWDHSGRGRWYTFETEGGRKKRRTVAGPAAPLSDLHAIVEKSAACGSVEWLADQYHSSTKFKQLAKLTRADYEYSRGVLLAFPTATGGTVGALVADKLRNHHLQRLVDRIADQGTPTKANKMLRYARLLWRWGVNRGFVTTNPAQGLEAAKERKRQRNPKDDAYIALRDFAKARGARTAHTEGSAPPYLWLVMELGYLCRLRGIETITLTEAHGEKEGLRTNRRKGSRDNLVQWTPRLRAVWDAALMLRKKTRGAAPELIRPEDRFVFLAQGGEPLSKSGLDTAWQRLVAAALDEGVITAEQRFSLHDLKRKGGTDIKGNRAEKQDALGVSEAMMKVYDKSVPSVKPSA